MKWLALLLAISASPSTAQTVTIKSGDHADFTRLVLTFPNAAEWRLGRTDNGYELQRTKQSYAYDLTDVYRLITKARLKSIWADPATGRLQMGIDCACHAIPFEFSQNTLVIDIRDGSPPAGSIFEQSLSTGTPVAPLGQSEVERAAPAVDIGQTYDWLDAASAEGAARADVSEQTLPSTQAPLEAAVKGNDFRSAVIDQLAEGATEGVVEIVPKGLGDTTTPTEEVLPDSRIALGDQLESIPGVVISDGSATPPLTEQGDICPLEDSVDLASWVDHDFRYDTLSNARGAILGEFDQPNSVRLKEAVRTYLYYGFGAEARNLMSAFESKAETDLLAMGIAYLVDGESPPGNPFAGMQTCDSSAAFWALAATQPGGSLAGLKGTAVARTFMGLPQHLKLAFAQGTVEGLMRLDDNPNAEIVRAALERAAPENAAIVPLLDAEMALQRGDPGKAEAQLGVVSGTALAPDALLALIETRFQQRRSIEEPDVIAIEAFAFENRGGVNEATFQRALTHAQALGGDFASAFESAAQDPELRTDVWLILAALGQPGDLLSYASGGRIIEADKLSANTKATFARKLVELGLPNAARGWLPDNPEDLLLTAEVALANKDGRAALKTLAIEMPDADPKLLARAFRETGNYAQAASVLRSTGDMNEALRLERWAGLWPTEQDVTVGQSEGAVVAAESTSVRAQAAEVWKDLAALRSPQPADEARPQLEASRAHLDDSAATRGRIAELLNSVPRVAQ